MSIDWDAMVLGPVMGVFGEANPADPTAQASWPTYYPQGGAAFQLACAVFDRAYADIVLDPEQGEVTSRKPCLGVRLALFAQPPQQNDMVFIPSVALRFVVSNVQDDGHGQAKLILMVMKS